MPARRPLNSKFGKRDAASVRAVAAQATQKQGPSPDTFVEIPLPIVEAVGLRSPSGPRAGGIKLDLAVLAGIAFFYQMNKGASYDVRFNHGGTVHLDETTILLSLETVARNLYLRWLWGTPEGPDYRRIYEWCRHALKRLLAAGHVRRVGYPFDNPRARAGALWTLEDTPLGPYVGTLPESPATGALVTALGGLAAELATYERDGFVDVVDLMGGAYAEEEGLVGAFTGGIVAKRVDARRRPTPYYPWLMEMAAEGSTPYAHAATGVFRPADVGSRGRVGAGAPSFVPYVVIEIDGKGGLASSIPSPGRAGATIDAGAVSKAHASAVRFVEALGALGADPATLCVCYSGNRGYHVHVPAGLLGNPVFREPEVAKEVLGRFVRSLAPDPVDEAVLSPNHLVRAIGSKRPDTGLHKLGVPGDVFLYTEPLEAVWRTYRFAPTVLSDPRAVPAVPGLVRALREAATASARSTARARGGAGRDAREARPGYGGGVGDPASWPPIYRAAMAGVVEGEGWWPGHVGRSDLLFTLACFLVERGADDGEALAVLDDVNTRNVPPMTAGEVRGRLESAKNTVSRRARPR